MLHTSACCLVLHGQIRMHVEPASMSDPGSTTDTPSSDGGGGSSVSDMLSGTAGMPSTPSDTTPAADNSSPSGSDTSSSTSGSTGASTGASTGSDASPSGSGSAGPDASDDNSDPTGHTLDYNGGCVQDF